MPLDLRQSQGTKGKAANVVGAEYKAKTPMNVRKGRNPFERSCQYYLQYQSYYSGAKPKIVSTSRSSLNKELAKCRQTKSAKDGKKTRNAPESFIDSLGPSQQQAKLACQTDQTLNADILDIASAEGLGTRGVFAVSKGNQKQTRLESLYSYQNKSELSRRQPGQRAKSRRNIIGSPNEHLRVEGSLLRSQKRARPGNTPEGIRSSYLNPIPPDRVLSQQYRRGEKPRLPESIKSKVPKVVFDFPKAKEPVKSIESNNGKEEISPGRSRMSSKTTSTIKGKQKFKKRCDRTAALPSLRGSANVKFYSKQIKSYKNPNLFSINTDILMVDDRQQRAQYAVASPISAWPPAQDEDLVGADLQSLICTSQNEYERLRDLTNYKNCLSPVSKMGANKLATGHAFITSGTVNPRHATSRSRYKSVAASRNVSHHQNDPESPRIENQCLTQDHITMIPRYQQKPSKVVNPISEDGSQPIVSDTQANEDSSPVPPLPMNIQNRNSYNQQYIQLLKMRKEAIRKRYGAAYKDKKPSRPTQQERFKSLMQVLDYSLN